MIKFIYSLLWCSGEREKEKKLNSLLAESSEVKFMRL